MQYWVIFDGAIDVVWTESMNTALDDNLTLCLASGERMKLRAENMRLLFEVEDLLQASPATVRSVPFPHNLLPQPVWLALSPVPHK